MSATLTGKKGLLVEDNKINQLITTKTVEGTGVILDVCSTGKDAIEKVRTGEYDFILMDINMPILNGYETTKMIREMDGFSYENLPVIAMSAYLSPEKIEELPKLGINGVLNKPLKKEEFIDTLSRVMDGSYS